MHSPKMKRPCNRCGEMYLPNSRFGYVCSKCIQKKNFEVKEKLQSKFKQEVKNGRRNNTNS